MKKEVGGSIPGCEISSLLDRNLPGGQLPPMIWRRPFVSKKRKKEKKSQICWGPLWPQLFRLAAFTVIL